MKTVKDETTKYILFFTLPSGNKFAATILNGKFGLTPIKNNKVENVLAFDTPTEVSTFLKDIKKQLPPEEFAKYWALKPDFAKISSAGIVTNGYKK